MDELEELPASRQGPFGYEFPGLQCPPRASGPPLLNPSEDRVLDNFLHGVGSDQGWLDDELLISADDPRSSDSTHPTRPPMPPPVQHIMTSFPAPSTPASQIFQEPLGLSDITLRDATTFFVPTPLPYANVLHQQAVPRDPGCTFFDLNNFNHQVNASDPNHSHVNPVFDPMTYTRSVDYLHSTPRFGPGGQDAWLRHQYSDRPGDPMLCSTHPSLNQRGMRENLVQFGSDLRFSRDHFEAPDHHQTEARLRATMLGQVQGLLSNGSVGESRSSSPDAEGPDPSSPVCRKDFVKPPVLALESEGCGSPLQGHSLSSLTKPKTTALKRGNSITSSPVPKTTARSRKNKGKRHVNLSNEQRVDNHRQSEQRRRDEIRNSYVALKATIPGMGDKKTKGAEMQYTVTWMRQTLKENEELLSLLKSVTRGD
ncbi:MAG: hypothetical protein Q9221_006470 [Calogaya cf. arnoldii]